MNKPMKIAMGAGLLAALLWSPITADDNADAYKLPDRAQAYATDDAAMQQARKQQAEAKGDVVRARQQVVTQDLLSPKYKEAVALVDSTNARYQTLKRQVQAELTKSSAPYQALLKDRAAADQELKAARGNSSTPYQTFQDLYAKKEKVTTAILAMEDAELDKAGGATARTEWKAACAVLDDMKKAQRAQVEGAPQVVAAKEKVAQSQHAVDEVAVKLAGSQAAYEEASYQQGKQDDYDFHHQGDDSWDYWGGYGYGGMTIYRGAGMRARR